MQRKARGRGRGGRQRGWSSVWWRAPAGVVRRYALICTGWRAGRTQQRVVLLCEEPLVLTHVGGLVLRCRRRDDGGGPESRVVHGGSGACGEGIHGGSPPRAHLRHVAHVPTHVFDALHAVPQVAHEAVTVPYEREDRDHRRHRVRWIASVKAGQPAGWRGRGGSGPESSRVPHSRDGQARTAAEVHCRPTALPSSRSRCALPLPASARTWVVWHSAGRLLVARLAHPVRWHAENERTLQVEQQLGDHGGVLCNARHASTLLHQPDARRHPPARPTARALRRAGERCGRCGNLLFRWAPYRASQTPR